MWSRHSLTHNHEREYINSLISRTAVYVTTKRSHPRNDSNTFWPNNRRKKAIQDVLVVWTKCCATVGNSFLLDSFKIITYYWNEFTAPHWNKVAVNYGRIGLFFWVLLFNCQYDKTNSYMCAACPHHSTSKTRCKKQVGTINSDAAKNPEQ